MLAAVEAVPAGRPGPGMPGSARAVPGEHAGPAAGFGSGQPLDTAPGGAVPGSFLEQAAGDGGRYAGVSDDELAGVICEWDRAEAAMAAGKHAAVAELIRRRPAAGAAVLGGARMPEGWGEFTGRELGAALGVSAGDAEEVLDLAWHLEVNLPGTKAAFGAGMLSRDKAAVIAWGTALLDPGEARAAVRRAVMQVNPEQARKRREHAARRARVQRWAEDSGNAGLAGRELPPAEVLAADQRVTAWARELRRAGLDGGMDQLRARAFIDLLLGTDSRPPAGRPPGTQGQRAGRPGGGSGPDGTPGTHQPQAPAPAGPPSPAAPSGPPSPATSPSPACGPLAGLIPPGFAGRVTLTVPAITLTALADRPGELARHRAHRPQSRSKYA